MTKIFPFFPWSLKIVWIVEGLLGFHYISVAWCHLVWEFFCQFLFNYSIGHMQNKLKIFERYSTKQAIFESWQIYNTRKSRKAKEEESSQKCSVIFVSFTPWEKKNGKPKSPKTLSGKGKEDWSSQERQISRQELRGQKGSLLTKSLPYWNFLYKSVAIKSTCCTP